MFIYPHINPVALKIGPLAVHWYGLMYIVGFFCAWGLGYKRAKNSMLNSPVNTEQLSDLIFFCALGVVLGGRIGYVLIYAWPEFIHNPFILFKIWQGGMSFHGGLLGVITVVAWYAKKTNQTFFAIGDFLAPLVPLGLAAGRIGNFINGELWGRVTDTSLPWAMIYPYIDNQPRHPSEIYEFLMEGVLLFLIVWFFSQKPRPRKAVSGVFFLSYGCFRCIGEFFRQPDIQMGHNGYIAFGWLTTGQLLSLPMIIIGGGLMISAYRHSSQGAHNV
jgi:phosphatidylglycerol:prolipoprotein diacylglycerol transferase